LHWKTFVYTLDSVECEWDPAKNKANIRKHDGIDFADAQFVFEDQSGITLRQDSANGEERYVTLGVDNLLRLLVVVFTYRADNVRIISARLAEPRERKVYEE
jgi:uncharacterized DUF497 family protein